MKTKEKKELIAKVIEKFVQNGYDITEFIGKPLNYFDEERVMEFLNNENFE